MVLLGLGVRADGRAYHESILDSELGHVDGRPRRANRRGMVWGLGEEDLLSGCVVFGSMLMVVAASAMLAIALGSKAEPTVQRHVTHNLTRFRQQN